jgi:hypothetical protein
MKLLDVPWEGFLKPKMESNPKVKMERESFEKEKQNADCVEDGASHGYGKVKVVNGRLGDGFFSWVPVGVGLAGWVMGFPVGFRSSMRGEGRGKREKEKVEEETERKIDEED